MAQRTLNPSIKKIAERYVERLRKDKYPIVKAFAFGSRLRGDAHADSDLDIAIVSPRVRDPIESAVYLLGKTHELDRNEEGISIEPHGFSPENFVDENPLAWEIKQTGVPVA